MKKSIHILSLILFVLFSFQTQAAISPVSVSIMPPVQFPPESFSVTGVRASVFWGKHRDLYGFDFGIIGNMTQQSFVGSAVSGIFNYTEGSTTIVGIQLAGIGNYNKNKTNVVGVQLATIANYNSAASSVTGLQIALANLSSHTDIYGAQIGVYNVAQSVYGFQIGLVNVANNLHGIQIGIVNFNHTGLFAISPIINIGF